MSESGVFRNRASHRSGAGSKLNTDARLEVVIRSQCAVSHPPSDLDCLFPTAAQIGKHLRERFATEEGLGEAARAAPRKRIDPNTTCKSGALIGEQMIRVDINWIRIYVDSVVGSELRPSAIVEENSPTKRPYFL
jgi:hypothetical protein